jgi:hypothetical protein
MECGQERTEPLRRLGAQRRFALAQRAHILAAHEQRLVEAEVATE